MLTTSSLFLSMAGLTTANAQKTDHQIHGTVVIDSVAAYTPRPNERLIIKFYYPDQGIEKDQTYRIFTKFDFPFEFHNGPDLDMSRRTKWKSYVVEVFTDIDGDVLTVSEQEYFATSHQTVAIGSKDLVLKLAPK